MATISHPPIRSALFKRYPDGAIYRLEAIDQFFPPTPEIIDAVYRNCAFGPAWHSIFYALFPNGYHPNDAISYLNRCQKHWNTGQQFPYMILSARGEFAGVIDLKSTNPNETEVGYWADPKHRGIMTNALGKLGEIAAEVGYQKLVLYISADNPASLGVARRSGYRHLGSRVLERWGPEWSLEFFEKHLA